MMTTKTMDNVMNRLMQVHGCRSIPELLDKVLIIMVGDHCQVSALPMYAKFISLRPPTPTLIVSPT